jgi:glycerophosphoryl diester phosphodiesterase
MKFIAHRGNISGPNVDLENTIPYIESAINMGYDCEIDLWYVNDGFYLGHDRPEHFVTEDFLHCHRTRLWCHAKNKEALIRLISFHTYLNTFWHDKDDFTITSKGDLWCRPTNVIIPNAINLMPEIAGLDKDELRMALGICSDYVERYR